VHYSRLNWVSGNNSAILDAVSHEVVLLSFKLWKSINNLAETGEQHAHKRVSNNDETLILSQGF